MINSAEEFIRLRTSDNSDEYLRATWDEAPLQVWFELVDKHPDMRFWVAQNKSVPVEVLELLASDEDSNVRAMVASKNRLPEHLQLKLAKDSDGGVRKRVVYNKKATIKVLHVLEQDFDEEVRALAQHRIRNIGKCLGCNWVLA